MKNWRTVILVAFSIAIFWFLKFYLNFPSADAGVIGIILSISSILFGFLAGFFISELWTRYTEIRELQGSRSSAGLNMINYAEYFFKNKKFRDEFKSSVEKSIVADEIIDWDEGHIEIPYYRDIESSFRHIKKLKNKKDEIYFDNLINAHHDYVETTVRLDTLYKERLFSTEWFVIIILSVLISMSILFLDGTQFFYQIIILIFPVIVSLALSLIYDLDKLLWGKERLTMEPVQIILDSIGAKRFYLKSKKPLVSQHIKDYRTEDSLTGGARQVYLDILKKRKLDE